MSEKKILTPIERKFQEAGIDLKNLTPENLRRYTERVEEETKAILANPALSVSPEQAAILTVEVDGKKSIFESKNMNIPAGKIEWKDEIEDRGGVKVKVSKEIMSGGKVVLPKGAVTEYIDGDYKGEQLFNYNAAMYWANQLGKRLPDIHQLSMLMLNVGRKGKTYNKAKEAFEGKFEDSIETEADFKTRFKKGQALHGLKFAGYRYTSGDFHNIADALNLWSAEAVGADKAPHCFLISYGNFYSHENDQQFGFSVRCLQD